MKSNKGTFKVVLLSIGLVAFITVLAVSFAYFTLNYEEGDLFQLGGQATPNTPNITFSENKSGVNLSDTYPMPDSLGKENSDAYEFTVTNETTSQIQINAYLQISTESTLSDSLVNILYGDTVYTVSALTKTDSAKDDGYNHSYLLGSFTLDPNASKTESLKMWVNENGNVENALTKTWSSKVYVTSNYID